eukprot:GAHX01001565.1.p1 GENE.GAHX01001565.1~~GAHX01001565.1.p1  ORF type:complete len:1277 (-),score=367.54 GAHX01001565.1:34-3864(-)
MTYLRKLAINGIRSYNPNKVSKIDFLSPITVIVGRNGSGKTSIIEALKYICTGTLPPESQSGKNFVCDRKLGTSTTIDATIELEFQSPDNKIITATRNFKTITSATRKTFKAVDGVLKTVDGDGNIVTGSHTVTNFDKIVPLLFRSNKSILENVVFCHQDDSLWPLSDPASLKAKFDYIFCSSKLNKSLETILKTKKQNESQYKDEMITYEKTRILKDQYLNINTEMESLEKSIQEGTEKKNSILQNKNKVKDVLDKINNKMKRFSDIKDKLRTLENSRAEIKTKTGYLREGIVPVDIDNEYLSVEEIENELKKNKKELENLENDKNKFEAKLKELYKKKGMLENIENVLSTKNVEYENLMSNCNVDLKSETIENLIKRKTEKCKAIDNELTTNLKNLQEEINTEKNKTAIMLSHFETAKSKLGEIKGEKKDTERKFKSHLTKLKRGNKFETSECDSKINYLKLEIENKMVKLETISIKIENNESITTKNNKELEDSFDYLKKCKEVEAKQENITFIKKSIESYSEQRTAKANETKEAEFYTKNMSKQKHSDTFDKLNSIFNTNGEILDVLETEAKLIKDLTNDKEEKEKNLKKLNLNMNSIETENKIVNKQINDKESELKTNEQNKETLEDCIKKLGYGEGKLTSACNVEHKIKELESSDFISGLISESETQNKCGFCDLKFPNKGHIKKIKSKFKVDSKDNEEKKETINKLIQIKKKLKDVENLKASIGLLKKAIDESKTQVSSNIEKIKEIKKVISMYETKTNDLKKMVSKLYKINESSKSILNSENELSNTLKSCDVEQGKFDIAEMTNIENGIKSKNKENEKIIKANKKLKLEMEQLNLTIDEKTKLLKDEEALKEKHSAFKNSIGGLNLSMLVHYNEKRNLNILLSQKKESILRLMESKKLTDKEKESKVQKKTSKIEELKTIYKLKTELNELTQQKDSLLYCVDKIKNLNKKLKQLHRNKEEITLGIENLQTLIKNAEIQNKIKTLETDVVKLNKTIKETKQLLAAKESLESLEEKKNTHTSIADELSSKINSLQGKISEQESQIGRLKKQLESDQLSDINEKYRVSFVKMQFFQKAAGELKQLHKDLEYSLMTYHSTKMKEVNEVLVDLWRSVYTGSDIEYIWIDSKNEMNTGTTTKRSTSSYNYSIVMMQNRKFLPLKGRCSAGQKVLASLLIRLALSEVFCSECGILTLDEPTTNLDDDNIEALAEAIIRVIQRRISQGDFQMILITHDEKFVEKLRVSGAFDEYYRVYKDNYQFSNIKKRNVYNQ